jgi:undecaprenyl-diphosphatase
MFWVGNHHSTMVNQVMKVFTALGNAETAIAVVLTAAILFYLTGQRRAAVIVVLISMFGLGISQSAKYVIKRQRPDVAWRVIDRPHSPSFPSGHSLNSMAIYGTIALLAARRVRRRIVGGVIVVAGLALPLAIGVSRPYLGVHYPSDVLAGWTVGLACALLALWADRRWGERECSAGKTI